MQTIADRDRIPSYRVTLTLTVPGRGATTISHPEGPAIAWTVPEAATYIARHMPQAPPVGLAYILTVTVVE